MAATGGVAAVKSDEVPAFVHNSGSNECHRKHTSPDQYIKRCGGREVSMPKRRGRGESLGRQPLCLYFMGLYGCQGV